MLPHTSVDESADQLYERGKNLGKRLSTSIEKCSRFVRAWVLYRWCRAQGVADVVSGLLVIKQSHVKELRFCPHGLVLMLFGDSTCRLPLDSLVPTDAESLLSALTKSTRANCIRGSFAQGFYSGLWWGNILRTVFWAIEESCRGCATNDSLLKLDRGCLSLEVASVLTAYLHG
jgi:hypothetical protein